MIRLRLGGWLSAAKPQRLRHRQHALEQLLDKLAARVAIDELSADRHAEAAFQWKVRALAAEDTLIRLQESLDRASRC